MPENTENNVYVQDDELYNKKIKSIPAPPRKIDIDLDKELYNNIIEAGMSSKLDMSALQNLNTVAESRNQMYNMFDVMCEDGSISAVVETYAEDATETNEKGNIVWVESSDSRVAAYVEYLLDTLNIDKNIYKWVYSLCKYGDVYLRLYRDSDYFDDLFNDKESKEKLKTLNESKKLEEDVQIVDYKKNDNYVHYMEMVSNPAEMFELTKFGKTVGYVKSPVYNTIEKQDNTIFNTFQYKYKFKRDDITVYPATEFVHAALEDDVGREDEIVDIFINDEDYNNNTNAKTYKVRKGQSLLSDIYKTWKILNLLENSVLLYRVTKSSITRVVSVEVGDMPKENVAKTLLGVKSMIEQKSAINTGNAMSEYTNPGPIENNVYVPTHGGVGNITTQTVGGDVDVKSLADLDYFLNKLYGCLRGDTLIPLCDGTKVTIKEIVENKEKYIGKEIKSCSINGEVKNTTIEYAKMTKPEATFIRFNLENGKYIDVTPDHLMMLKDGRFIEAKDITENDLLMSYDSEVIKVITIEELNVTEPAYDITVSGDDHTFLTDAGIFVHNCLRVPKQFFCLRGNTPILLLNGETITIKEMFENIDEYIGKGIMSCNEDGTIVPTKIKNIMLTKPESKFIRIHLDNGEYVDVTPEHRMMMRDGSFVEAKDIKINDSLMPYNIEIIKVTNIEELDIIEPAYDIEVEADNHTFALPCGIFVHNCQTDDSTGFNGGTSLTIISSRYAKMVKRIQNTILQALTDAINLMLLDKELDSYVNNFTLHMLNPTTQEEIDRRENLSSKIQICSDVLNMLSDIEDQGAKLKILKSLLSETLYDSEIVDIINDEIEKLEKENEGENEFAGEDEEDLGMLDRDEEGPGIRSFNDTFGPGQSSSNTPSEGPTETNTEGGQEPSGGEEANLPSPSDLGVDLTNAEEV